MCVYVCVYIYIYIDREMGLLFSLHVFLLFVLGFS